MDLNLFLAQSSSQGGLRRASAVPFARRHDRLTASALGISLPICFDNLPEEHSDVRELLDRIDVDVNRPRAVDLGRPR